VPELPEVETVRHGLQDHVVGRTVETVRVLHPRAVRRQPGGAAEFETALGGRSLDRARRRGKYLWLSVGEDALLAHLGMSGQLLVGEPERPLSSHVRILFTFADGGPDLRFTDQRTFGHMCVVRDGAELPAPIAHIAPDPFEPAFDPALLARRLRLTAGPTVLMLLAGTVPILTFVVERWVTHRYIEPALAGQETAQPEMAKPRNR